MRTSRTSHVVWLGVISVIALVGGFSPPASAKHQAPLQATDLFSWACEKEWCFLLIPHQESRLEDAKILSHPSAVHGVRAVVAQILKLPNGGRLTWALGLMEKRLAYPPEVESTLVRKACLHRNLSFYGVPDGPLEEVASLPTPARKAHFGQPVYYLDHRWFALPDFTLRYLRSGSIDLGEEVAAAGYQEFEVSGGGAVKTIRTDPSLGAWVPSHFEFGGRQYVLEVNTSVFQSHFTSGDLFAWPADDYERRVQKRMDSLEP